MQKEDKSACHLHKAREIKGISFRRRKLNRRYHPMRTVQVKNRQLQNQYKILCLNPNNTGNIKFYKALPYNSMKKYKVTRNVLFFFLSNKKDMEGLYGEKYKTLFKEALGKLRATYIELFYIFEVTQNHKGVNNSQINL